MKISVQKYIKKVSSLPVIALILCLPMESFAGIIINPNATCKIPTVGKKTLVGQTPDELVQALYFGFFVQIDVTTTPCVGNLLKYIASSPSPTFLGANGFVDENGNYATIGSKLITKPRKISKILARSTPAPEFNFLNLNAFVTTKCGRQSVIYVDSDNRYILAGGEIITNEFQSLIFTAASVLIPNDYSAEIYNRNVRNKDSKLTYLLEGNPKACKTIYVIGEPNCPFCHMFWQLTLPYVQVGTLSIHWTFASFINPTSPGRVFAIWDADLPPTTNFPHSRQGALTYNEVFFDTTSENGGIPPSTNPSHCAIKLLNQTYKAFFESITGVPFIMYKDTTGQKNMMVGGPMTPEDMDAFISTIQICKKK